MEKLKKSNRNLIIAAVVVALISCLIGYAAAAPTTEENGETTVSVEECPDAIEVTREVQVTVESEIEVTRIVEVTPLPTATSEGPVSSFGNGIWIVGQDIVPGTYTTLVPDGELCYWERLKGFGGEFSDIIANGSTEGGTRSVVTISESDAGFNSQDCGTWKMME